MSRQSIRAVAIILSVLLIVAACLFFPRALFFVERAARELRYLWWLVLMLALGIWLTFFFGKPKQ